MPIVVPTTIAPEDPLETSVHAPQLTPDGDWHVTVRWKSGMMPHFFQVCTSKVQGSSVESKWQSLAKLVDLGISEYHITLPPLSRSASTVACDG